MTSASKSESQQVQAFKRLNTDEQLAVLALIYNQIADSLPSGSLTGASANGLVTQVEQLSQQEQLDALRDLLPAQKTDQDEVVLDPHPSKALVELATGGNTVKTGEYGSLDTDSKLAFWYQLAQKLGSTVTAIPTDYHVSSEATEFLNSFSRLDREQQLTTVGQLLG